MAKAETLEHREVLRMALQGASSWDPETRQFVAIAATSAPQADGIALDLRGMRRPERNLPVYINHNAHPAEFIGAVVALEIGREKGLDALIATIQLADSPVANLAVPVVASGAARFSIRARVYRIEPGPPGSDYDRAVDWESIEISLVGNPMDTAAVTRSAVDLNSKPTEDTMTILTEQAPEATPTAAEIRRARAVEHQLEAVLTCAPEAARPEVRRLAETEGLEAARAAAIDARAAEEMKAPTRMGSYEPSNEAVVSHQRAWQNRGRSIWANASISGPSAVAEAVQRAWDGKAAEPLWLTLRSMGYGGRNAVEVIRGGMHSTSDLPLALTGSGNRQLLAQFSNTPQGVRNAASVVQLADYRPKSTLDVGLVGKAKRLNEGSETPFASASEQAATYRPNRHSIGLGFSPESLANDDLGGIERATAEMGAAMLEAEAEALAELLEGNALGGFAPDGKRLFHADHANTVGGPLGIASLEDAVAKLRRQTTVGGRFLYQEPGAILCSPDIELIVRQLLSDTLQAAEPANVNPWRNLEVEVDPQLGQQFVYLLPAGARRPLELGRLTPAPVLESETDFDTGMYRIKCEHAFGCAVVDHRPIVRLTVAA